MKLRIDFERCSIDSYFADEDNDCAVRAVAIATQTAYQTVLDLFTSHGRKRREGSWECIILDVLAELGYKAVYPESTSKILYNKIWVEMPVPVPKDAKKYYTLNTIAKRLKNDRIYLVSTNNHISAFVNGKLQDSWLYVGRKYKVRGVWRIVPKSWPRKSKEIKS